MAWAPRDHPNLGRDGGSDGSNQRLLILSLGGWEILRVYPEVGIVLVGDGTLRRNLELECQRAGIGESVSFLGWWRDLTRIYTDLDGEVTDLIDYVVTGFLVPPKSPTTLADVILRLNKDDDLRRFPKEQAKDSVYPKFNISSLVEYMSDL